MANLIVIGTQHELHLVDPVFNLSKLVELIHATKPDIICAELSPEQLFGKTTCNSKPEYPKAILPYAYENGIEVIPIQPPTEEGYRQEERNRKVMEMINSDPESLARWKLRKKLFETASEAKSLSLHSLQSRAYDHWMEILWEKYQAKLFPEFWNVKEIWNIEFLNRITKTIESNREKRITVTVGIKHKHWLNNRLDEVPNVKLEHIEDYIDTKDNVRSSTECAGDSSGQ
ncbi:hypothetical protein CSA37_13405 [Candidatus Fermentibacteria bacterium]|nr:MAG: hypothetical protein CSA37_13405 [Candidatus Fermentibacteria bacterium]